MKIMKRFNNLKVASKVLLSCSILILLLIAAVIFSITTMRSVKAVIVDYRVNTVIPLIKMDNITSNLLRAKILMLDTSTDQNSKNIDDMKKRLEEIKKIREENIELLKGVLNRSMTADEKTFTDQLDKEYTALGLKMKEYNDSLNSGDNEKIQVSINSYSNQLNIVVNTMKSLNDLAIKEGGAKITDEFKKMDNTIIYMIIILIASVIVGVIVTIALSGSVSKPVQKGLAFAQKLAGGDFTERIDLDQNDELGVLARALNKTADNLEKMVTEIIGASNNLAQAVEQIASGNQNLSQRTSEQASALEEVSATIEEANSSINQNYESSLQASRMAESSSTIAVNGGELVNDAINSINDVNSSAKRIGEITSVINEIAFQTNLLALNAAVEAARAGEQGRGFAVVAGEVRNLAQRAGNSAKEITRLIHDTVTRVENGTEKTYKSGESLKEIIGAVKDVAGVVSEIAAASNEQKQGMDQIAIAIADLDTMTQHNAALVEETAGASEEMANQAQELISLMTRFKIRENEKPESISYQKQTNNDVIKNPDISGGNGKRKIVQVNNDHDQLKHEGYELF